MRRGRGVDFRQSRVASAEWASHPSSPSARTWLNDYTSWATSNREFFGCSWPTNMTESSANKLLNGDVCHRSSSGKKSGKNGFVKNHCLFQQPQKYRRLREKVRPNRQLLDGEGPETSNAVFIIVCREAVYTGKVTTFDVLPNGCLFISHFGCEDLFWLFVMPTNRRKVCGHTKTAQRNFPWKTEWIIINLV